MLCFVFAALVVILDQFFKHFIVRSLDLFENMELIPGVIGLTHIQNTGAAFSLLADQRWLLACIAFVAAVVLVFILLRYTEGFWGTLGLAAVLGGTIGNLIDRVFNGYVVDMFRTLFINFAVFNVADIFITLGFITFCIHFIAASVRSVRNEKDSLKHALVGDDMDDFETYSLPDGKDVPDFDDFSDTKIINSRQSGTRYTGTPVYTPKETGPDHSEPTSWQEYYESKPEQPVDISSSLETLSALESLESELNAVEELDVDDLLREYGFEDEKD